MFARIVLDDADRIMAGEPPQINHGALGRRRVSADCAARTSHRWSSAFRRDRG